MKKYMKIIKKVIEQWVSAYGNLVKMDKTLYFEQIIQIQCDNYYFYIIKFIFRNFVKSKIIFSTRIKELRNLVIITIEFLEI